MQPRRPWYKILYLQVLIAIIAGVVLGYFYPNTGAAMKPLGDGFIQLIKMMIAPVIFCTIVHGIATMGDLKKVGRVGIKTLVYFEVISTLALIIGLIVGELAQPGSGFNIDASKLDPKGVASYVTRAKEEGIVAHLLGIIPNSFFDAFAKGDLLQVLLIAILSGVAISGMGETGAKISGAIDAAGKIFERVAHEQGRNAARVFDVLDPAISAPARFGQRLAVLARNALANAIEVFFNQLPIPKK